MAGFGGSHSPAVGLDPPERRALTQVSGERELGAVGSQSRSAGALCGRRTRALQALGGHRAKWLAMLLATSAGFAGAFVQSPGVIRVGWTSQGTAGRSALGAASFISERRPAMATMRMRPRFVLFSSLTMSDEDKEQDIVKRIEDSMESAQQARQQLAEDVGMVDSDNAMQDAIERALKKADAVLEELQNTTAGKVRREGAEQLKALRDKKLALQEQEKKKAKEVQEKVKKAEEDDVYTASMREVAAAAARGIASKPEALAVLKEMEEVGIVPNSATFAVMMDVLAKAAAFGKAKPRQGWDVLRLMDQRNVEANAATLSSLLSLMARSAARGQDASLQDGLKVISYAEEHGVAIDAFMFSSLLSLCAHAKVPAGKTRLEAALAILEQLSDNGVERDTVVYNNVLTVCGKCRESTIADAFDILADMDRNGVEASAYTFSILLSQCAADIRGPESAKELVQDAEQVMELFRGRNIPPSVAVYNSLLKVLGKAAAHGAIGSAEADAVLREMDEQGVRMNIVTLSSWLTVIGKAVLSGRATRADARLAIVKARELGLAPSVECYNLWLDCVGREALMGRASARDAIAVVEYMRSVGQGPGTSTYNRLMSVAARTATHSKGSMQDGKAILALMEDDEVPLSPVSLSALIQLARADGSKNAVAQAWELFRASPPSIRNERVFTVMTSALNRAGQKNTALTMLDLAKDQGLQPNTFMFNAAMGAARESGDIDLLWEQMQTSGIKADSVTNRYLRLARRKKAPTRAMVPPTTARRRGILREKRRIKGEPHSRDGGGA